MENGISMVRGRSLLAQLHIWWIILMQFSVVSRGSYHSDRFQNLPILDHFHRDPTKNGNISQYDPVRWNEKESLDKKNHLEDLLHVNGPSLVCCMANYQISLTSPTHTTFSKFSDLPYLIIIPLFEDQKLEWLTSLDFFLDIWFFSNSLDLTWLTWPVNIGILFPIFFYLPLSSPFSSFVTSLQGRIQSFLPFVISGFLSLLWCSLPT